MGEFPFTRIQVDELIRNQKYTSTLPQMKQLSKSHVMACQIYLEEECTKKINLRIYAQISINPICQSFVKPSCVLLWFNQRIRGINWHIRKENSNGERIENWHEHIWTDEDGDDYVEPVELDNPSLGELFNFCLNQWNIKIVEEPKLTLFGDEK